jgi:hypothetical protein
MRMSLDFGLAFRFAEYNCMEEQVKENHSYQQDTNYFVDASKM